MITALRTARATLRAGGVPAVLRGARRRLARKLDPAPRPVLKSTRPKNAAAKGPAGPPAILDAYVHTAPSAQCAVDIFQGEWSSQLPAAVGASAGRVGLFDDARIHWAIEQFGGVDGYRVLELGPLEGGHSHLLSTAGADVLAVEGNTRAYLKCLVAKELTGSRARFLLGDFMAYLREPDGHFDLCLASGVLYHMREPMETLALTAAIADRLFLWTHYWDAEVTAAKPPLAAKFEDTTTAEVDGFEYTLHRYVYGDALESSAFCGGNAAYSNWLSRADLLAGLVRVGWSVDAIAFDEPDHLNGPALALVATRQR
jgi:hypothetical protein